MRIYFSERSDPMITGTVHELNVLARRFDEFVQSGEMELVVPANLADSPAPYDVLLPSLRLLKRAGPITVSMEPKGGLCVAGSAENLATWCSFFRFRSDSTDGDHHHPESVHKAAYVAPGTLSTIIEIREDVDGP